MVKIIDFFWGYYGFVDRVGLYRNYIFFFVIEESDWLVIYFFCV